MIKKVLALSIIFSFGFSPSFANIQGGISKGHFYDAKKTIMSEIISNNTPKTQKYWENNMLYAYKYHPLFLLSNKELYNLMPRDKVSVVQRIATPSIYNISLKTASIKNISLSSAPQAKKQIETKKNIAKVPKIDSKLTALYEESKNPQTDTEKKIEAALLLKDSKNFSAYPLAIDLLDDITRKEPYNAYAFYIKGELYSEQNNADEAMRNYVEALKLNPTSKQSCLGIAKILEPTNRELAQKYYDKAK